MLRVLVTGDRSVADTGFAVYKKNLLRALNLEPDIEAAEFAFAGYKEHKQEVPWRLYPCCVHHDDPLYKEYKSSELNKHGVWRWEKTLLHFKPHIVISPIDPWQTGFQVDSALKRYYHLCTSPPIDSHPIKDEYIQILNRADSLVSYTQYGRDQMEGVGLTVDAVIPMGVNISTFHPFSQDGLLENRRTFGIPENAKIFGFICRNQPRKRIPELMCAFRKYLDKYNDKDAYLYIHTTYPDIDNWDLPKYLFKYNITNRVFFSYKCIETGNCFARLFSDRIAYSPFTGKESAEIVNVNINAPTAQELNKVYNLFDVYIQAANCEGFGSPQVEAASTNTPIITIDYSAMSEVGKNLGAILVPPKAMIETKSVGANRAIIDTDALADAMNQARNLKAAYNGREIVKANYDWDQCCTSKWVEYIRSLNLQNRWSLPYSPYRIPQMPEKMRVSDWMNTISSLYADGYGYNPLSELEMLYHGGGYRGTEFFTVDANRMAGHYQKMNELFNHWEEVRIGRKKFQVEDWML